MKLTGLLITDDQIYPAMKRYAEKECNTWSAAQLQRVDLSGLGPHAQASQRESLMLSLEGQCHSAEDSAIDQLDDLRLTGKLTSQHFEACMNMVISKPSYLLFFSRILECATAR
jgi:hypothetical protein